MTWCYKAKEFNNNSNDLTFQTKFCWLFLFMTLVKFKLLTNIHKSEFSFVKKKAC